MEYESRKVKWYWLFLFVLFCSGTVYLLFSGNPYLYSHLELRSALTVGDVSHRTTIPQKPSMVAKLGNPMGMARFNFERTGMDPSSSPRSRSYEEYESHPVDLKVDGFEPTSIVSDDAGFYLTGKSPWVIAVSANGSARWRYRFADLAAEKALLPVLVDDSSAYLIHPTGEVVCVDKANGQIRWLMDLHQEVVAPPFLWAKNVIVPVKGQTGVQLVQLHRQDGQTEATSPKLDIKPGFQLSYGASLEAFIATVDNKIFAFDPDDWSVIWTQTLTDPIKGPAVVVDHQIFVATLGPKIVKLDGSKKGKIDWELDLEKPAAGPPSYLPIMQKLSLIDTTGALVLIDAKAGKPGWREGIEARGPLTETWSARLKGNNIEEFKMDWLHKGWTVWSPCSERRFCIYTPGKGQLIQRVQLSGQPLALPFAGDHSWLFFVQQKPGKYAISRLLEENEIKKLRAQATKGAE